MQNKWLIGIFPRVGLAVALSSSVSLNVWAMEEVNQDVPIAEQIRSISERQSLLSAEIGEKRLQGEMLNAEIQLHRLRNDLKEAASPPAPQQARTNSQNSSSAPSVDSATGPRAVVPAPVVVPILPPPDLIGVRGVGEKMEAIFSVSGVQVIVAQGEKINSDYKVERINGDHVTISKGSERTTFKVK